jgi:hypothetical protein
MMSIRQQGGVFGRNPKFNDVEVESLDVNGAATVGDDLNVGNGVLFVDKSTGRVGVNTSTPDQILTTKAVTVDTYHNIKTDKASGTSGVILANDAWTWVLRNNGGNSNAFELRNATSGQQELTVTTAGNFSIARGNLAFASGKGIDFSATSGTGTSELFDDYEEGTWTPTTAGDATGVLGANNIGFYVKTGRLVHVQCQFVVTTNFTSNAVGGLPYQPYIQSPISSAYGLEPVLTVGGTVYAFVTDTTTNIVFASNTNGTAHNPSTTGNIYRVQFTYVAQE